jgi:hypothetical protein
MKNSDKENARIEHHKALQKVVVDLLSDHAELSDSPSRESKGSRVHGCIADAVSGREIADRAILPVSDPRRTRGSSRALQMGPP